MLLPEGSRREVPLPEGLLPEAVPMVFPAVQPGPLMAPRSARPAALRQERAEGARPAVPAGVRRGLEMPARQPAHLSAAAARKVRAPQATEEAEATAAQRLAQPERLVPPALRAVAAVVVREAQQVPRVSGAQPPAVPGEVAAPDVTVGRQPVAESTEAAARPREAAAVQGAVVAARLREEAAGPDAVVVARLPEEAPDAAEVALPPGAARVSEAEAPRRAGAAWDAEVPQQVARGEVPAVRPSAAA